MNASCPRPGWWRSIRPPCPLSSLKSSFSSGGRQTEKNYIRIMIALYNIFFFSYTKICTTNKECCRFFILFIFNLNLCSKYIINDNLSCQIQHTTATDQCFNRYRSPINIPPTLIYVAICKVTYIRTSQPPRRVQTDTVSY